MTGEKEEIVHPKKKKKPLGKKKKPSKGNGDPRYPCKSKG